VAQISPSDADDLLSKLLSERIPLVAFFRSPVFEARIKGFVDSKTQKTGITISVSGPPIDVNKGYIVVRALERLCDCWYGEKRELPESFKDLSDEFGESVLTIRFLESKETLALFFTF
jgi:hypothetical protein